MKYGFIETRDSKKGKMTARTTRPDVYERSKQRKNPPEKEDGRA